MTAAGARHDSVLDTTSYALAGAYAEGLLAAVPDNEPAEALAAELAALAGLLAETPGLEDLLTSPMLSRDERCRIVRRAFEGRVSEPLEALVTLLARNGRGGLIRPIARRFRRLLDARQGRVEVTLTTAVKLDEPSRRDAERLLGEALGAEPVLTTCVDPALLGGVVVRVGDRVFDASLATQLRRLKKAIVSRKLKATT